MTNTILCAITWTFNLLGFLMFSLHPNFGTRRIHREERIRLLLMICILPFFCMLMMYLHLSVVLIAAALLVGAVILRIHGGRRIRTDVILRAVIWIGVMMAIEICIIWLGLGTESFFVSRAGEPITIVPLYWVVLIGLIQLFMQGIEYLRTETTEASRILYIVLLLMQLPTCALLAVIIRDTQMQENDEIYLILLTLSYYLSNAILLANAFLDSRRAMLMQLNQVQLNQYEYYLHMEEEHRKVRRIHHDLKNQIMMLQEHMASLPESVQEQIHLSEAELIEMDQFAHTGQRELNILLFNSRKKAEKLGIRFEFTIAENSLNFMDSSDLNTLFLNAVNNAFEACEHITDGEKFVEIKAGAHLNDVLVLIRNSADPSRKIGDLRSSKQDRILHGLGIPSMRRIAARYNGYLDFKETEDVFQLTVLFVNQDEIGGGDGQHGDGSHLSRGV